MSNEISISRWMEAFYKLYKRHVEAVEIQSEAVLEIREILVRTSDKTGEET